SGARVASQPDTLEHHVPGMWGGVVMAQRAPSAQAWLGCAGVSAQVWHPPYPALRHPSGACAPPTASPAAAPPGTGAQLPHGPSTPCGGARTPHRTPAPAASPTHAVTTQPEARHPGRAGHPCVLRIRPRTSYHDTVSEVSLCLADAQLPSRSA